MMIGVLALQGAVREHMQKIEQLGIPAVSVKTVSQLQKVDGLIIPGGESTTISKLLEQYDLTEPIRQRSQQGMPLFGTCAGLIVLARRVENQTKGHLHLLDVTVKRNAFGRQKDSFEASLEIKGIAEEFQAVFIRAPLIQEVGKNVEVLAAHDDKIVAVRQDHLLGVAFHPELTASTDLHQYFVQMTRKAKQDNIFAKS